MVESCKRVVLVKKRASIVVSVGPYITLGLLSDAGRKLNGFSAKIYRVVASLEVALQGWAAGTTKRISSAE